MRFCRNVGLVVVTARFVMSNAMNSVEKVARQRFHVSHPFTCGVATVKVPWLCMHPIAKPVHATLPVLTWVHTKLRLVTSPQRDTCLDLHATISSRLQSHGLIQSCLHCCQLLGLQREVPAGWLVREVQKHVLGIIGPVNWYQEPIGRLSSCM